MAHLEEENIDGVTVLHIRGNLMSDGLLGIEPRFHALAQEHEVRIVVDMGQVGALTTPSITLMLRTTRAVAGNQGRIIFANLQPTIARMFACCRLDLVLKFAPDVAEAVRECASGSQLTGASRD